MCKINTPRRHKTDTSEDGGSVKTRKRNPGMNKYSKWYSVETGRRLIQGIKRNPNWQPLPNSTIPTQEERFLLWRGSWLKSVSAWRNIDFYTKRDVFMTLLSYLPSFSYYFCVFTKTSVPLFIFLLILLRMVYFILVPLQVVPNGHFLTYRST